MIKNKKIKNALALILGASFALGGTACNFFPVDVERDLAQTVATVDITDYLSDPKTGFADYANQVETIMSYMGTDSSNDLTQISKRDLVSSFVSTGATYINSYGYTYRQTFKLLMSNLVNRKIMVQYAFAYYLKNSDKTAEKCNEFIQADQNGANGKEKELLKVHPEISVLKYFLQEEGDLSAYNEAVYLLKKSINDSLDTAEKEIIKESDDSHDHGETRTLPKKVNATKEDHIPSVYEIYTGRNAAGACGEYERVKGSTTATRMKAYNGLLANLASNNLISKDENTSNFLELNYYYLELATRLEQALINKFSETLTKKAEDTLTTALVKEHYEEDLKKQQAKYSADVSAFDTALGQVSDTSFAMYAPAKNYGFVYNILLPFDALQTVEYESAKKRGYTNAELHAERAKILEKVTGKDLRESWFCEDEDANYAYEKETDEWYFFENQTGAELGKYEPLGQYLGNYAYNGTVTVEDDGSYTCKPKKESIDDFIKLMEDYLRVSADATVSGERYSDYVTNAADYKVDEKGEFTDYSQFMYYTGKVKEKNGDELKFSTNDFFVADATETKVAYTALSAFNELMFAYSTDTGCLNTYFGYAVSPFGTSFVPEFEYAAQYAIEKLGVGGYVVCPSTYGWHIIYVSYVLPEGAVYGDPSEITNDILEDSIETEGSFFNLYYEYLKSSSVQNYQSTVEKQVLVEYNNGSCVTLYEDRYENLMSIDE